LTFLYTAKAKTAIIIIGMMYAIILKSGYIKKWL
jgi:hypothetical protein